MDEGELVARGSFKNLLKKANLSSESSLEDLYMTIIHNEDEV
ncbi:MAG: hypothetical protein ABEI13_01415 [Candidatus Paceibacteria bacterium]